MILDDICIDREVKIFECAQLLGKNIPILGQLHKSIEYPTKWGPFSEARGSANEAGIRNQLPPSQSVREDCMQILAPERKKDLQWILLLSLFASLFSPPL